MVIISMLRGVNLGGHRKIKMDALRQLYLSLGFENVQTYLQSGNVVFCTSDRNLPAVARRIEQAIERKFGFLADVILRTSSELSEAIAQNPFAKRPGIEPNRLLVTFLAAHPDPQACDQVLRMDAEPEELRIEGRELYIYYPNGMARPKLPWVRIQKTLQCTGTGRNWNTVQGLLELAQSLEQSAKAAGQQATTGQKRKELRPRPKGRAHLARPR